MSLVRRFLRGPARPEVLMTILHYLTGKTIDSRQKLLSENMASAGDISVLHLVPTRGRLMELETDPVFWLKKRTDTHKMAEANKAFAHYRW